MVVGEVVEPRTGKAETDDIMSCIINVEVI